MPHRVSTATSLMSSSSDGENRFNIASCMGCMMGFGAGNGYNKCMNWACDGEVVKQSQQVCN
ncbi:hypothetical protein CMI46_02610 [Candidatus Pacearchaeota archaeon]|nr:hypothetical protein [Candidatus Pacearchaeota archaeon]|tara:strand:+ start:4576 stop:4761 length:186 start_codon:yes stop_codon:yes gene_type:complete